MLKSSVCLSMSQEKVKKWSKTQQDNGNTVSNAYVVGKCLLKQYICNYVNVPLHLLLLPKIPEVIIYTFYSLNHHQYFTSIQTTDGSFLREGAEGQRVSEI